MGAVYRPGRGRVRVVRRDGARELEVEGSFASFWEPGETLTRSVWDALAATVLALPEARRRRVLLLGLGAGSAARIVRRIAPEAKIVGVEIDPEVVRLARREFELDSLGVEVVVDDARRFLARHRGRYDAVVDDVFVGRGRHVRKPDWMLREGLPRAVGRLRPGGVLASNTLDETAAVGAVLGALLPRRVEIAVDDFDNRVLLAGATLPGGRALRAEVSASPVLGPAARWLRFRTVARARSRR